MKLQSKLVLTFGLVLVTTFVLVEIIGYRQTHAQMLEELRQDALEIRAIMMATRRVYHHQFIDSELNVNEKTLGFLPAHAMSRISDDFLNWSDSGLTFNNVSDRPRNPKNRADEIELEAMAWFRANPKEKERLVPFRNTRGQTYYHFSSPIWTEQYCLKCHGAREQAPRTVRENYDASFDYKVGDLRGLMSIKLPGRFIEEEVLDQRLNEAWGHLLAFAVATVFGILLLRRLVIRRLEGLKAAAGDIARGDYRVRIPLQGRDELTEVAVAFNDMADQRQRAEAALYAAGEEWQRSFDALNEYICILDRSGAVVRANRAMRDCFEPVHGDITGLDHRQIYYGSETPDLQTPCEAVLAGAPPVVVETRFPTMEGHYQISSYPLADKAGELSGVVSVVKDITERVRLAEALEQHRDHLEAQVEERTSQLADARRRAEDASLAKSLFLANVSHELRTPLNAIIGYSELVEEEAGELGQTELLPDVKKIGTAGRHLLGLINDILDLSKIEAGKVEPELKAFVIKEMVQDVAATVEPMMEEYGNRFSLSLAGDVGEIHSDQMRMRQVLINLLSNAAKFTRQGNVELHVQRQAREGGDWLQFRISDTGIGMSTEQQESVFNAFEQADASILRRFGGTGLGLAICKRICDLLNGAIEVESRPGEGSVFTVRFPPMEPGR